MSLSSFGRSDPRWLVVILVLSALAAAGLALLAWFVLPLVAFGTFRPFEGETARLLVVLAILVAWGVLNAVLRAGRNSADQARLDALDRQELEARTQVDAEKRASDADFAEIRVAARRAFRRPRRRRLIDALLGRGGRLPRYLVIGPPGSGKSSALAAADLSLPFDARGAEAFAAGAPCRFLVSDGGVFVEVAGDVMLDGRAARSGLWARLLDLLRAARSTQPVNGVLLVVAAADLPGLSDEARADLARTLRARLDEITHRLRVRAPVYVLLSKLDRVPGFSEFFENLGAEERARVWGVALRPIEAGSARETARVGFGHDFDDLVRRASARQLGFLHAEPDAARRTLAFEFPAQLAALHDTLAAFLEELVRPNRFDEPPLLRGVFLTSALQDGAAVDAIGGPMARAYALPALAQRAPERRVRRAYFLKDLFGRVIPGEAGSGGLSRRARVAARARTYGVRAAAAGLATAGLLLLWSSYQGADAYITRVADAAEAARTSLARLGTAQSPPAPPPTAAASFAPKLAALDDLGGLDAAAASPAPAGFVDLAVIRPSATGAYRTGLAALLVPPTMRAVEARLADPASPAALRFQCLKLYLLLGGGRRPQVELLADLGPALAADWVGAGEDPVALQHAVGHLVALADASLPPQPVDEALIAQARRRLTETTVAQIGYEILRQQPAVRGLRPWRPLDQAGSLGPRAVARASGASLAEGVRGLYTAAGLAEASTAAALIAEALAADAWVFGPGAADRPNLAPRALQSGILDLYRADYVRAWEALLSDLTVPPLPTAAAAADLLAILNGPTSPITLLLQGVVAETSLDREVGDGIVQGIRLQAGASAPAGAVAASPIASAVLPRTSVAALLTGPRQLIARQFAPLREAVTRPREGQDSDVETVLKGLDPLARQLLIVASGAPQPEAPLNPASAALTLAAINRLPVSIRPYFTRLAGDATALLKLDVRGRAAQAWATTVLPACREITAKAFPFDLKARQDVTLGDFTRLFSPNGLIAGYRRAQLAGLVDTSVRPWRWREGRALPSDPPDPTLAMFEQAEGITAAFFAEGDRPSVRFTLEPVRLDVKAEAMQFDIGGASLVYAHGPEVPFPGQWPPPIANAPATLSLRPEIDGAVNALVGEGPWGLFRLVAQGRFAPAGDGLQLAFDLGRRQVRLKVATPTLRNPFDLRQMAAFRCPEF